MCSLHWGLGLNGTVAAVPGPSGLDILSECASSWPGGLGAQRSLSDGSDANAPNHNVASARDLTAFLHAP